MHSLKDVSSLNNYFIPSPPQVILLDGPNFDSNYNYVLLQEYKKTLKISGILSKYIHIKAIDGCPVFNSEILPEFEYDYIIIMDDSNFSLIYGDFIDQYPNLKNKIVPIAPFKEPDFDFSDYLELIKNPPTIVSDNCFGGIAYHTVGLSFYSPLINMWFDQKDLVKIIQNKSYYLSKSITYLKTETKPNTNEQYPVALWGGAEEIETSNKFETGITLHLSHYTDFNEAREQFNRRLNRVNINNLIYITRSETNLNSNEQIFGLLKNKYSMISCLENKPDENRVRLDEYLLNKIMFPGGITECHIEIARHRGYNSSPISLIRLFLHKHYVRRSYNNNLPAIDYDIQKIIRHQGKEWMKFGEMALVLKPQDLTLMTNNQIEYILSKISVNEDIINNLLKFEQITGKMAYYLSESLPQSELNYKIELLYKSIKLQYKPANLKLFRLLISSNKLDDAEYLATAYDDPNTSYWYAKECHSGKNLKKNLKKSIEILKTLDFNNPLVVNEYLDVLDEINTDKSKIEMFDTAQEYQNNNNPGTIGRLARYYRDGKGCIQDLNQAIKIMEKAYNLDNIWVNELSELLISSGTSNNKNKAFQICYKAAHENNCGSMARLGKMYHLGIGVEKDLKLAKKWIELAVDCGISWAPKELLEIDQEMQDKNSAP